MKKYPDRNVGLPSLCIYGSLALYIVLASCGRNSGKQITSEPNNDYDSALIQAGAKLSQGQCIQCHQYTPPELLPRHIWKNEVLPKMGTFLGIYEGKSRAELVEKGPAQDFVIKRNVYPQKPVLKQEDWQSIKAYFLSRAPDTLKTGSMDAVPVKQRFKVTYPEGRISPPMTTMTVYKSASGFIYHSDVKKDVSLLNIYKPSGEHVQAIAMHSPAASIAEKPDGLWVLNMGSFTSTDAPTGTLSRISKKKGATQYNAVEIMIGGLQRPVDIAYADFDEDGDEDAVIAEFGNWAGTLEWFENKGNDGYERHALIPITGAEKVQVEDLNDDGHMDILALIAQGEESIFACINDGKGKFKISKILQVPPTYGSVYFDYMDINGDGIKDILHVSGDNADYEAIPKPYHGIRIYLGKGELKFEAPHFLYQPGAYKVIPEDFDGDGDLDLASISFFPDYSGAAKESFLLFENVSTSDQLAFEPFTIPEYKAGRWITMDAGDFDHDGDQDLVLGSFVVQNPYGDQEGLKASWMKNGPMFVMLENIWADD